MLAFQVKLQFQFSTYYSHESSAQGDKTSILHLFYLTDFRNDGKDGNHHHYE